MSSWSYTGRIVCPLCGDSLSDGRSLHRHYCRVHPEVGPRERSLSLASARVLRSGHVPVGGAA